MLLSNINGVLIYLSWCSNASVTLDASRIMEEAQFARDRQSRRGDASLQRVAK